MLYDCGANLESQGRMATYNLKQILRANFSADDDVRFIVMTGGSKVWQTQSEYLYDPVRIPGLTTRRRTTMSG